MRATVTVLVLVLGLATGLAGCGGGEPGERSAEDLGTLGARIYQQPDRADALLEEAGLTRESLAAEVRAIAADAEASRRYQEAFDRELAETG